MAYSHILFTLYSHKNLLAALLVFYYNIFVIQVENISSTHINMSITSNIGYFEHWILFVISLETCPLYEIALENVHICTLETRQLLLIQARNVIIRLE